VSERLAAAAKVNLGLEVVGVDSDGYHLLRSLVHTVSWYDELTVDLAEDDRLDVDGAEIEGENLVWQAVRAVRDATGTDRPMRMRLVKRIPVAAGLGGGSADAAAALVAVCRLYQAPTGLPQQLAPGVGADVPYLLRGGLALMEGRGERVSPLELNGEFALGIVVPPFLLDTATVYRQWDLLDRPSGRPILASLLPPSLRDFAPLRNDLEPAALAVEPDLGDWIAEMERLWDRPVTPEARASAAVQPVAEGVDEAPGDGG
jgi:4-diphosphocytidyl-2-C-methyl-D-erythritol kinase